MIGAKSIIHLLKWTGGDMLLRLCSGFRSGTWQGKLILGLGWIEPSILYLTGVGRDASG